MTGPHLIYFADPMCSWCWGFSPVIDAIREQFGSDLPVRLIMGGLRPGTTKPMDEAAKRTIREHWEHVQEATGQPFDFTFFKREGYVYDTEPSARAVVVVRRSSMDRAFELLKRIHLAFYAQGRDVTDDIVLAELASESGVDQDMFLQAFRSEGARQETRQDFAIAQNAGVRGFPSLLAGIGEGAEYSIVTFGYQPVERILPPLARWLTTIRTSAAHSDATPQQT